MHTNEAEAAVPPLPPPAADMATDLALDNGGFGRLDISDLSDLSALREGGEEETNDASPGDLCDWCGENKKSGDYIVVADNRHFRICPICWGRSAGYLELRVSGSRHTEALERLMGREGN